MVIIMNAEERTAETSTAENDNFSSTLDSILSNPKMLSMISEIATELKSGTNSQTEEIQADIITDSDTKITEPPNISASALPDAVSAIAPLLSGKFGASPQNSRRDALLCALKPYLSPNRSDAIDKIIQFSKISDLLKKL